MATMQTSSTGVAQAPAATGFTMTGGTTTQKTLTVSETATIDQNLAIASSPTFAGITIDAVAITAIETTITDDDTKIPTSGSVVDYVVGAGAGPWTTSAATPVAAAVNNNYVAALAAAGPLVFNLPATFAVGAVIKVVGQGAELFRLTPNVADFIRFGNHITKAGGYVEAIQANACIEIRGAVADSVWEVVNAVGAYNVETS